MLPSTTREKDQQRRLRDIGDARIEVEDALSESIYLSLQRGVLGAVHLTHAAFAELGGDPVVGDVLADHNVASVICRHQLLQLFEPILNNVELSQRGCRPLDHGKPTTIRRDVVIPCKCGVDSAEVAPLEQES